MAAERHSLRSFAIFTKSSNDLICALISAETSGGGELLTLDASDGLCLGAGHGLVAVGVVGVARILVLEQDVRSADLLALIHI